MRLTSLFEKVADKEWIKGDGSAEVLGLSYDSRNCEPGDVFFAIGGFETDGNKYIPGALANGASVIVSENRDILEDLDSSTVSGAVLVSDVRKAMSGAAASFYGYPSQKMKVIGITGTNGKSSTAFFLKELLEDQGKKVGVMGTLGNFFGDWTAKATHTTPESVEIHRMLKDMMEMGAAYCIMEVSSHALALYRVEDVDFHASIFTNISQDHLDFHHTMEEYFLAKEKLFHYDQQYSIVNTDDPYGRRIYDTLEGMDTKAIGFGIHHPKDFQLAIEKATDDGSVFTLKGDRSTIQVETNQVGAFNAYNLSCAILAGVMESLDIQGMCTAAKTLHGVKGRMEKISSAKGFTVIIDFAHTPDGLSNVLQALKKTTQGRIITVFGCGGDRDRKKRPIMGRIAVENSDWVVLTSDNPRREKPESIIEEIEEGMKGHPDRYTIVQDRRQAIGIAIKAAKAGDVVLVAGKGHESVQIIGTQSFPFHEREIIEEYLNDHDSH